jgi:hypothetical protein
MTTANLIMFIALSGIYEPSAIQQLPDGRFLVVEDEKAHPFSLVKIHPDGTTSSTPLITDTVELDSGFSKLDDLEGITIDPSGFIYAITSHSRNNAGEEKKSREKLVRFRIEGEHAVSPVVVTGLKAALTAAHPVLASGAAVMDAKTEGGLNIEALEITPDAQRLMIGFRSPLLQQQAIIASIENPSAIFEDGVTARISSQLITLDLGGHGIRGMSYIPVLGGYLVISGPVAREQVQFQLWFWNGKPGESPRRISVAGLPGFEHAEGVSQAMIDGRPHIIIVSDDGNREEGRHARFLLLAPEHLEIQP